MTRSLLTLGLFTLLATSAGWAQANKACSLATPAELEAVVGAKVSLSQQNLGPNSSAQICSGTSAKGTVMLRIAKSSAQGGSADAARKGIEMAKKMGAQVDVKTFGPITCSTMIPPKSMEQHGFNTTCSVTKPGQVAAIEVQAKARADMVPIEKLKPLAEKLATRF